MKVKTHNAKSATLAKILVDAGCKVLEVAVLGSFLHVTCRSYDAAKYAGKAVAGCGEFKVIKITKSTVPAEHQNAKDNAEGHTTWVDRYTMHAKLA